jgi:hypothetical protein
MAARVAARLVQRRFRSSGGKVLGEEEKAAENVYIKVSSIPHHLNPPPSSCAARARPWVFGLERDFSNARVYDGSTSSAFGGGGGRGEGCSASAAEHCSSGKDLISPSQNKRLKII